MRNGATLASAVTGVAYMPDTQVRAFIETGESSGTLPEMLFRYANAETESINQLQQQMTEWLPRLAYAVIAGWVAYSILGSHAFMPNLPEELR
jgi:general secretion pathway protein F